MLKEFRIEQKGITCEISGEIVIYALNDQLATIDRFKQTEKKVYEYLDQSKFYSIIKVSDYTKLNNDFKEYLISEDRSWKIMAEAVQVRGLAKKLMSDLYFQLNLPLVPTKTFVKRRDALAWLHSLLPEAKYN